jgi:VWFA-related protein
MPRRQRCLVYLTLLAIFAIELQSQTPPEEPVGPTLKTSSRLVVVDVAVTDATGNPIRGLRKEDFEVLEDGKTQTVSVFEEHTGKPPAPIKTPALPPDTFSNAPRVEVPDSLNVFLVDALNTPNDSQLYVHQQVIKYLTSVQGSEPIAIFVLSGDQLRLVHGFTSDRSALLAALEDKQSGSGPQNSPLLRSGGEIQVEQQAIEQMQSLTAFDRDIQSAMDALKQFLAESESSQTSLRVNATFSALRQLARYLAAFPGRKNLVWFSEVFPLVTFEGQFLDRDYQEEARKTTEALTRARVAVYPVEPGGLAPDSFYDAGALGPAGERVNSAGGAILAQRNYFQRGTAERTGKQATMDVLADQTGGKAFYNLNRLDETLAQVVRFGAYYYTLDYVPTNTRMDGEYRRIHVKLKRGHLNLSYRRAYKADDQQKVNAAAKIATKDPLQPLMAPGLPNFAQVRYLMSVKPATPQPELTAQRAGDNSQFEGPFTRMDVNLAVSEKALQLEPGPDRLRHGTLEITLVAYNPFGHQMNWLVRNMDLSISEEQYKASWDPGLQFHFEFDAPTGAAFFRSGVCDLASGKAGTMEVPLHAPAIAPKGTESH